jgi:EmrB/QacA subfamily drug resistance transporter
MSTLGRAGASRQTTTASLAVVCGVLFLTFLDTTIVSVGLGAIQSNLHAGVVSLQWLVNGYALVFATLMLAFGTLGDRIGRRRVMVAGVAVFCLGSLLSALAPTVGVLTVGRVVMGVGAAASEPGTLSVIRQLYPDERRRARAIGIWAAVAGVALALGPVFGGVLIGLSGWRAIFWLNVGAALVLFVASVAVVPDSSDPTPGGFDWGGLVLGTVALGALTEAVIGGETAGYRTAWIGVLFVIGLAAGVGFVLVERSVQSPMLDLGIVSRPAVAGPLVGAFALYFGVFSIFFFTALYLDEVVGYSGYRTAAQFGPMAVAMVGGSLVAGSWVARSGPRTPLVVGCVLAACGLVATQHYISAADPFRPLAIALGVAGFGFGVAIVPVTSAVLGIVPAAHSGMAASATNTCRQLGAVFGTAVLGAIVNAHLTSDLSGRLSQLGIPSGFQAVVIGALENGTVPNGNTTPTQEQAFGPIVAHVVNAAYAAFRDGLRVALLGSAVLIVVAAVIAYITVESGEAEGLNEPYPQRSPA